MDRRTFLKATSICAASTAAGANALAEKSKRHFLDGDGDPKTQINPNHSTQKTKVTLRTVSMFPDNLAGASDQLHKLATSINRASEDRITLDIASEPAQLTDAPVIPCDTHAFFGLLHRSHDAHPAALYMSGMPHAHALNATELAAWLNVSGAQAMWDTMFEPSNVKPILGGHLGELTALWSNFKIQSIADLTGRKVASFCTPPGLLRAIGATPIDVPPARIAHALHSGKIDAAEAGGFHTAMSLGLHKSASHVANGILATSGTSLTLALSLDTWKALSEADRELIQTCADQNFQNALAQNRALDKPLAMALSSQHGIAITTLTPPDLDQDLQRLADTYVAHIAGQDELSNFVNSSYSSFKNLMA